MSGIFISYRRSDSPDATGRIYDRLVAEFGKAQVFKDVDSIPLGRDFRGHLNDIVGNCGVMLAIVGPRWMKTQGNAGQRRLDDADDFVRIELEAALARDIPVVPVLVAHAPIPLASELPASLASMAFRQSIEVRPDPDFHNHATKLVNALREMLGPNAPRPVPPSLTKAASRSRIWMGAFPAAAVIAAALALPALKYLNQTPPPETRVDIVTPATDDPGSFAISPDGRRIVFVAKGDGTSRLWLPPLSKAAAQPLAGTEGATHPFWSPDSKSIGFFGAGTLKRLDLDGGQPQILAGAGLAGRGSWSSKGVILFSTSATDPLTRVSASGGTATELPLMGDGAVSNLYPVFLPDGEHFIFQSTLPAGGGGGPGVAIELGSLDGGKAVRLAPLRQAVVNSTPATYLPSSGRLLWIRSDRTLAAQRLDLAKKALTGEMDTLADAVGEVSASSTGVVAYRSSGAGGQRQLTWVDRTGALQGTVGSPDESLAEPRVSPVWSPDGSLLAFVGEDGKASGIYRKRADGAGAQEPLLVNNRPKFTTSWSREGYLLYFWVNERAALNLSVLPLNGAKEPVTFLQNGFRNGWPMFSPDGNWVAYQSNATGRYEVFVRPFVKPGAAAQDAQWQVSTSGGGWPVWRADGKELYFIDATGMMLAAPMRFAGSSAIPGTSVALFQTNMLGGGNDSGQGRQYDVAKDGRFLINRTLNTRAAPITLIQNWDPEAQTN